MVSSLAFATPEQDKLHNIMQGFADKDIIYETKTVANIPNVVVGRAFYPLAFKDKALFMGSAYGYFQSYNDKVDLIILSDWRTGKAIGSYSNAGLVLQ